jgi:hypothetical protein
MRLKSGKAKIQKFWPDAPQNYHVPVSRKSLVVAQCPYDGSVREILFKKLSYIVDHFSVLLTTQFPEVVRHAVSGVDDVVDVLVRGDCIRTFWLLFYIV